MSQYLKCQTISGLILVPVNGISSCQAQAWQLHSLKAQRDYCWGYCAAAWDDSAHTDSTSTGSLDTLALLILLLVHQTA